MEGFAREARIDQRFPGPMVTRTGGAVCPVTPGGLVLQTRVGLALLALRLFIVRGRVSGGFPGWFPGVHMVAQAPPVRPVSA